MVSSESREKIFRACEELDYKLNPSIQKLLRLGRNGQTRNLAFVMVGTPFADPGYSRLLDGIAQSINEYKYHLVLCHLSGKEESFYALPATLRDGHVDGILVSGRPDPATMELLRAVGKPIIVLGAYSEKVTGGAISVQVNLGAAMSRVVSALRGLGKRRIAYFSENLQNHYETESFKAYKHALAENDLKFGENLAYFGTGAFSGAISFMAAPFASQPPPFDAIVCLDFRCAQEISHLIMKGGFDSPGGILLATTRPFPYSYYRLPVPAVYLNGNADQVAYQGVKLLVAAIEGKEEASGIKLELTPEVESCTSVLPGGAGCWPGLPMAV